MKDIYYDFSKMITMLLKEVPGSSYEAMEYYVLANYPNYLDYITNHDFIFIDLFDTIVDDFYFKLVNYD